MKGYSKFLRFCLPKSVRYGAQSVRVLLETAMLSVVEKMEVGITDCGWLRVFAGTLLGCVQQLFHGEGAVFSWDQTHNPVPPPSQEVFFAFD